MNIQKIVRKNPKSLLNLGKFSNFQPPPFIPAARPPLVIGFGDFSRPPIIHRPSPPHLFSSSRHQRVIEIGNLCKINIFCLKL